MNSLIEEEEDDGSYMQLVGTDIFKNSITVFTFLNSKEPLFRVVVSIPNADATSVALEDLFHFLNRDHPEAEEHVHELAPYLWRLNNAET